MRYYLNFLEIPLCFILTFISSIVYIIILGFIFSQISKILKIKKIWIGTILFGTMLLCWLTITTLPYYINDGKIRDIYFLNNGKQTRMIVWYTHEGPEGPMMDLYSNRLKSFDLKSGKQLGKLNLNLKYYMNDYQFYGLFDGHTWGHSNQNGTSLINLFDLKLVLNHNEIGKQNKKLGNLFKLADGKCFDKKNNGLLFYTKKGELVQILPQYTKTEKIFEILPYLNNAIIENNINLKQYLKHKKDKIFTILNLDNEILVFITRGGYTLFALRINSLTGDIIGKINYF